jgi:hypothetical protein
LPGSRVGGFAGKSTANTGGNKIFCQIYSNNKETDTWKDIKSQGIILPFKVEHTANIGGINQDITMNQMHFFSMVSELNFY